MGPAKRGDISSPWLSLPGRIFHGETFWCDTGAAVNVRNQALRDRRASVDTPARQPECFRPTNRPTGHLASSSSSTIQEKPTSVTQCWKIGVVSCRCGAAAAALARRCNYRRGRAIDVIRCLSSLAGVELVKDAHEIRCGWLPCAWLSYCMYARHVDATL